MRSRFLRVGVGRGVYVIDAGRVLEVFEDRGRAGEAGTDVPVLDLRALFADTDGAFGCLIRCAQNAGGAATLVVDRVAGLLELDNAGFAPLPPIGPAGALIDAVCPGPPGEPPMLRLRAERAAAVKASDRQDGSA